jgi:hypothetical protein
MFSIDFQIPSINDPESESNLPVDNIQKTNPTNRMRIAHSRKLAFFMYSSP